MPIIDLSAPELGTPIDNAKGFVVTPGEEDVNLGSDAPDLLSTISASFRQDNMLAASAREGGVTDRFRREDGFNPWDSIKGSKYERHWDSFLDIRNSRAADEMKRKLDQDDEDRKLIASAPWYSSLIGQVLAGGLDLPTLLPGGAFVKGAKGGYSLARSAANVGAAAGVGSALQEATLHGLQVDRTAAESAMNIGGSVLFAGLLGAGGAKLLSGAEWSAGVAKLEQALEQGATEIEQGLVPSGASAGAAAVSAASLADNAIAGRAASGVAAATAQLNPALRALTSPSPVYREEATKLFENSLYLKKNADFVASEPAVETLMKEWNAGLARAVQGTESAFSDYVKASGGGKLAEIAPGRFGLMTRSEFRQEVGKAMRRGDESDNPHVAKVAQEWRAKVFDPLKQAAIEMKLLPEDVSVETATSYFSRMWNRNRLVAQEGRFKQIVSDWVQQESPKWAEQFDRGVERRLDPLRREIDELEMEKLRRGEEFKERRADADTSEMGEADIRRALQIVEGGAPKPKGVKSLSQFVVEAGGLMDYADELASRGITNKVRPGMIRKERRTAQNKGGWELDDMARHAWENGYFPEHAQRPSIDEFVESLNDDFHKVRRVVKREDMDAFRLQEYVDQLEMDLSRAGVVLDGKAPRFSTSEEMKGAVERVYKALDAEADRKIAALKDRLSERETDARVDRESRFIGDPRELARQIADEVFDSLTGKAGEGPRPEFITIKARGPLKERTFNIPDHMVEDFLESDVDVVGRRYARVMGADVELARKFGSVDLVDQIARIREDYKALRAKAKTEKERMALDKRETSDLKDLKAMGDMLRGVDPANSWDKGFGRMVRSANHVNYLRSMGEVAIASLAETVRPAMVHGLMPYMATIGQVATNLKGIKMSVAEAKLAGNVVERALGQRLATLSDIADPYASRGPVEAFLENMTNVASRWNGIRLLTDMQKSIASVMTQDRILGNVGKYGGLKQSEKRYMAYIGIDESMAGRISKQFAEHGETVEGVRVANTEDWADDVARRTYRAAMNKDVDSIITTRSVADVPLFASTPTGRAVLQFKSFALASHQRVLLRGLQEGQGRFLGGMLAMTMVGMMATWLKAISGNRQEKLQDIGKNPGWWISEGLDRSGVLSVPMEVANAFEKATNFNPIKAPIKAFDGGSAISQRMQNRNKVGAFLGPSFGLAADALDVAGVPGKLVKGDEVAQSEKNAAERLIPFNSYFGLRSLLRYVVNPPN